MSNVRHLVITSLLCALLAAPACTPTHDGRLLVTVSTDLAIPGELARVEISTPFAMQSFDPPLPFSVVVAATSEREAGAEVAITARGYAPDGALIVTRTIRTSFVPNRTLIVPLVLPRVCSAVGCAMAPPCPEGSVCTERGCGSERVEPADLGEARTPGQEIERSPDAGLPVGLDPVPAERLCAELAAVQCDAVLHCCPTLTWSGDERDAFRAACLTSVVDDCRMRFEPVFADPRVGYDAARAASALAEGRRLTDPLTCSLAFVDWFASSEGLLSVMRGSVLVGQDCTPASSTDLAALYACQSSSCQYRGSSTFTCAPRACYDEPCVGDFACADGLSCTSNLILAPGQCALRRPVGEPCTDDGQCESYLCNEQRVGTRVTPGTCQARTANAIFCPSDRSGM